MNFRKKIFLYKVKATTLFELMVVMLILGILASYAVPEFTPLISKAKSQEAKAQLKFISNLEKQYFFINSKYSIDLDEIDFIEPKSVKDGGTANYQYEIIEASTTNFTARAEAVVDFDGDGVFNVWEINQDGAPKEVVKD